MLLAEYVLVSVSYSADRLRLSGGWWSELGLLDPLGAVLMAVGAASLLVVGKATRDRTAELESPPHSHRLRIQLTAHAICFASFFAATGYVFGPSFEDSSLPVAWAVL
ncbi:MAG TPA: hypothetical protein VMT89_10790, partial [Candidatus Acidoferrales bacterium]|nr:hypothetical protein [Candidatus Acidoferrales bacterium]